MASKRVPLFVDTAAFFARFNERAHEHERAVDVFEKIRSGVLPYDPLLTSRYVCSEFATLMLRKVGHAAAASVLQTIRDSRSFNVVDLGESGFERACEQFARFDDQQISFVDHTSGVLASAHDVDHVFTFDESDFRTLGFTVVPGDTGEP